MVSSSQSDNDKILKLVGAIILTSQDAERYLKAALPFTNLDDPSIGAALKRHDKLKRRPLGELTGKLVDATTSSSLDLAEHLAQLVHGRNQVAHHFNETYGADLASGQHHEVIEQLEVLLLNLQAFRSSLEQMVLALFESLRDVVYRGTPQYEEMAELCSTFRARVVS